MTAGHPKSDPSVLGVVLAGGQSRRFGSDKALADVGGIPMIERATDYMQSCCANVVIVGRQFGPSQCIPDWPEPHRGPLGGIAGALKYAQDESFESILTVPVDMLDPPKNLLELLGEAPAVAGNAPTVAHWPTSALNQVCGILEGDGKHSLQALAEAVRARTVELPNPVPNINTRDDLKNYRES